MKLPLSSLDTIKVQRRDVLAIAYEITPLPGDGELQYIDSGIFTAFLYLYRWWYSTFD